MRDLHELPKLRDGLSYLYLQHGRIKQKHEAVEFVDQEGHTMIPAAALAVLMLGPGTSITHAAVKALADNGCLVVWCGEDGTRCYAQGGGETRKAYHLLHQARLASDPEKRMEVVLRMYPYVPPPLQARFGSSSDSVTDPWIRRSTCARSICRSEQDLWCALAWAAL